MVRSLCGHAVEREQIASLGISFDIMANQGEPLSTSSHGRVEISVAVGRGGWCVCSDVGPDAEASAREGNAWSQAALRTDASSCAASSPLPAYLETACADETRQHGGPDRLVEGTPAVASSSRDENLHRRRSWRYTPAWLTDSREGSGALSSATGNPIERLCGPWIGFFAFFPPALRALARGTAGRRVILAGQRLEMQGAGHQVSRRCCTSGTLTAHCSAAGREYLVAPESWPISTGQAIPGAAHQ